MKLYKRDDLIEFESQTKYESDQLNFLYYLLSKVPVQWGIYFRDGKYILTVQEAENVQN